MKIIETALSDVLIVEPDIYGDHRGYFMETYQRRRYRELGIKNDFVQDNMSFSMKGILRGLHFQLKRPQAKLVQVIQGEVYDVAVDIRNGSPDFGEWVGVILSENNKRQMFIPEGFAHGFCVLSDYALFSYKCSEFYDPSDEMGVFWADPDLGIQWPMSNPTLSEKDMAYSVLNEIPHEKLPSYNKV